MPVHWVGSMISPAENFDGAPVLSRIEASRYRPSKKLLDHVAGVIRSKPEFVLLDEQKLIFDRIKKALSRPSREPGESVSPSSQMAQGPVSEWAATRGFGFSIDGKSQAMALEGNVRGKPWRLQLGAPSRQYIRGEEIRARGELGIDEDMAVLAALSETL